MNNKSLQITLIREPILLGVLALILLNLTGNAIYWCYLLLPIFLFVMIQKNRLVDFNSLSVILFSVLYFACLILNGFTFGDISGTVLMGYLLFPPIFYLLGKYLFKKYPSMGTIYFILFFICILYSIVPFLDNVRSVLSYGFMSVRSIDYSMRENEIRKATITGGYFAMNMTLLPLLFCLRNSAIERKLTVISLYLFVIGLFAILNMSNRTGLFLMVLSFISFFIITRKRIKSAFILVIFLAIIIGLYIFDVGNLQSWFEHSRIVHRISQTGTEERSRFVIWSNSIKGLLKYPFGFYDYDLNAEFAHNLWLDVGRRAGIIPMIPLLIFTITIGVSVLKISLSDHYPDFFKVLIAGFGIGCLGTFFVEPALEGFYILFYFFCFYAGLIQGIREFMPSAESDGDHQKASLPEKQLHANLGN